MQKNEERGRRGSRKDKLTERERSNSTSILEFTYDKRKRDELERQTAEIFKRSNMMDRTPPGEKRLKEKEKDTEENRKRKSEEGAMIALLRELKEEMASTRIEIRELKESWKAKEERMEKKIERN
ncbi:uncharacterized protein LOC143907507 [Temnothorax americanus]|uniref:uncharacterized protein LOC143907507 n=1 Tax=Temnothorax americanus TaxID=1964332 RepID=UPI004068EF9C